jgi:hypothetical protein
MDSSIYSDKDAESVSDQTKHFAVQKLKNKRMLYLFMLGLLLTGSAILIIYQYQNNT